MGRPFLAFVFAIAFALFPAVALAAPGTDGARDILVRVRGDAQVAANERVGTLVVIDGDAQIDGTITHNLVVINGNAVIRGQVLNNVTVISGSLELTATARVNNANLIRSSLVRAPGAKVSGHLNERQNIVFRGVWLIFSALFWVGMTIAVLAAGLLFAAVGGRQLRGAAQSLTGHPVGSIAGALVVVIGLPIVAVLLVASIIGLPLGLGVLLFLLPALWLLGYLTVGTRIGFWITGAMGRGQTEHPYLAALVGLLALQLVALIPALGALIAALAGAWGAGGLAVVAWQAVRGHQNGAAAAPVVTPLASA